MRWFSDLNQTERKTFIAAFGGWALDALDFMVFTFVIATLMASGKSTQARPEC